MFVWKLERVGVCYSICKHGVDLPVAVCSAVSASSYERRCFSLEEYNDDDDDDGDYSTIRSRVFRGTL